ncbi:endolytic transglycosylase MltG [Microbacterium sp. NPDC055903]
MAQGDLFDNLPDPSTEHPTVDQTPAAPGSRRAAREAAQRGADAGAAEPAESSVPHPADTPQPVTAAQPVAASLPAETPAPSGGSLDDLFAPDEEDERPAERRKRRKGCLVALIVVLVVLGGIAAGGVWVMNTYGDRINEIMGWGEPKDYEAGEATGEAQVTIVSGDTGRPISAALFEAGVTKTEDVFYDMLIDEGLNPNFQPGVYQLQQRMTAAAALEALENPENRLENTVSIREGGTIASSLPTIAESLGLPLADLEAAVADPSAYGVAADSLEGWIFPAMYTFDPGATATDVIARMVDRTRESLATAGVPDEDAQRVLTIASIIQREGRLDDFAKVSRVIQNRLDDGMKLQMDSTAQYGYGELHAGSVSTSEEAQYDDNPWNTYVHEGLPVGPIANPSDAAIDAAMHPVDGPWFYFVTVNPQSGETIFSVTYEEHLRGVEQWRQWCRDNPDGC